MTTSHWVGLIIFGSFALFALLCWWASVKHPEVRQNPVSRRFTQTMAWVLLVFGAGFGYWVFTVDYKMRVTTLHEEMVEGKTQTIRFTVEHPGVRHELLLAPTADLLHPPKTEAEIRFSLKGPKGQVVLPERIERFGVRGATTKERADWYSHTIGFVPTAAGPHTLPLQPLTPGIPRIHIYITDPQKRNGHRIPGY